MQGKSDNKQLRVINNIISYLKRARVVEWSGMQQVELMDNWEELSDNGRDASAKIEALK